MTPNQTEKIQKSLYTILEQENEYLMRLHVHFFNAEIILKSSVAVSNNKLGVGNGFSRGLRQLGGFCGLILNSRDHRIFIK